jgi:hypothetical protein
MHALEASSFTPATFRSVVLHLEDKFVTTHLWRKDVSVGMTAYMKQISVPIKETESYKIAWISHSEGHSWSRYSSLRRRPLFCHSKRALIVAILCGCHSLWRLQRS